MIILNSEVVRQSLPMSQAISAMKRAYAALSAGRAEVPLRSRLPDCDPILNSAIIPHAERWKLPDGSDLVELSIKVEPGEATAAEDDFIDYLESLGLEVGGDQQTKTRGALDFFTTGEGFD